MQVEYAHWDKLGFESNNREQDERNACVYERKAGRIKSRKKGDEKEGEARQREKRKEELGEHRVIKKKKIKKRKTVQVTQ